MFSNLHNHTRLGSLLDGLSKPKDLAKRAIILGQPAVAVTEHGTLHSALKFYKACKNVLDDKKFAEQHPDAKVKPILGCEVYVTPDKSFKEREVLNRNFHLILLAKNEEGWHNLCKIASDASIVGFYQKPRTDLKTLWQYGKGIIATSACRQGEIAQFLMAGEEDSAEQLARTYCEIFDQFYLEIEASNTKEQYLSNQQIVSLARKTKIPLVATNDSHYVNREDGQVHDVLLAMQTGTVMSNPDRFKLDSDCYWFKSEQETRDFLALSDVGQDAIEESINNTIAIADHCNVELPLGRLLFPAVDLPENKTAQDHLTDEAQRGLDRIVAKKNLDKEKYQKRLNYELGVINESGLASYFLMVQDIYREAARRDIPRGWGRGSAAGALTALCLGITQCDPLKHNLSFERFWCPGRIGMPDIDCDFDPSRRMELFQYLIDKYGVERCSHICTFGTLAARSAIRDVARVLEISLAEADMIAKAIPEAMADDDTGDKILVTIEGALEESEELKMYQEQYPELFRIAITLEGMPRHTGVHAAGVVISPIPLFGELPLMRSKTPEDPLPISQFDMGDVEEFGMIKMDLLGVNSLGIIWNTIDNIRKTQGKEINAFDIPIDDASIYKDICDLKNFGIFQICTNVGKGMCSQIQPQDFDELVDILALARPGPMKSGQDKEYVFHKIGIKKISYVSPLLEPILKSTKGCMLYQEQLMWITRDLAGFSYAESDKYRKAVAKKKAALMVPLKKKFIDGCVAKQTLTEDQATELWDQMERYGGYCFNLSHSVSYAYVTNAMAWLKHYYPVEFMAATLTNEYAGSGDDRDEKIMEAMFECRNNGVRVLPPNINESTDRFVVVGSDRIRFPLNGAKGVGDAAMEKIIETAPYASFEDFMDRVPKRACNKKVVQILILAGAFDSLFPDRVELMKKFFESRSEEFDPIVKVSKDAHIKVPPKYSFAHRLEWERVLLGAYISGHPLDVLQLDTWKDKQKGSSVIVAGKIYSHRKVEIKKGKSIGRDMAICNIDTKEGQLTVILFPDQYDKFHEKIRKNNIIKVRGRLDERNGETQIVASDVTIPKIPVIEDSNENVS